MEKLIFLLLFTLMTRNENVWALTGRVLENRDGRPVPGARITIEGEFMSPETNEEGRFILTPVKNVNTGEKKSSCPLLSGNTLSLPVENYVPMEIDIADEQGRNFISIKLKSGYSSVSFDSIYLDQGIYLIKWSRGGESGSIIYRHMNPNVTFNIISQ